MKLFKDDSLYFLPDAIVDIKKFTEDSKKNCQELDPYKGKRLIESLFSLSEDIYCRPNRKIWIYYSLYRWRSLN